MKKRILFVLTCIILLLSFSVSLTATESAQTSAPDVIENEAQTYEEYITDEPVSDTDDISEETDGVTSTYHTLFTRLFEYCETHKTELIGVLGDVAIFILALFIKIRNDKKTTNIAQGIISIKSDTSDTNSSQTSVVGVVNDMVDGYNALKESYDKYGATEDDRNRVIGALVAQNTAILEILTTVYVNSKNLPQGVKDLVNIKYANCLKSLDNDEQLKAIVTAVRENIGTNMNAEPEEEEEKGEKSEV